MPQKVSQSNEDRISNISDSKLSKDAYKRACITNPDVPKEDLIVLLAVSWSDDFDPNSSIKANRGAVWIKTVTFISESFSENKIEDTYTGGIGSKQ